MYLDGKTAIIFGGGGAIGGATAEAMARDGARVFIAGRTKERLQAVAGAIRSAGGSVETDVVDVMDATAVTGYAASVASRTGGIDVALNATAFLHDQGTPLSDLTLDTFMTPVDAFLRSLFITSKAVAPRMGGSRPGVILTLSAPGGKMAAGGHLGHCVSCAGIEAFSRVLADEMGPRNVRVICVRPHAIADAPGAGSYTRDLFRSKAAAMGLDLDQWLDAAARGTMLGRLPRLAEVAETMAFLASARAGAMTAAVINLSAGTITD